MTALTVRKPEFAFDATTPFQWNPANPEFGIAMNGLSFLAPPFERYLVTATRMAMDVIADPAVKEEADAFLRQEAAHARAHRSHVAAIVGRYPGLRDVVDVLDARFDRLLRTRPLSYHLAYAADIEATFTPLFDLFLRHHDTLFDNGDHNVAPLFMWHFVEEIEHRCSAQSIYDAVVHSPWYRLRHLPSVFTHMLGGNNVVMRGFDAHVPRADRIIDASDMMVGASSLRAAFRRRQPGDPPHQFAEVPRKELARLLYRLARSQRPRHSPATEPTPPFADEWLDAYVAGRDVWHWYADDDHEQTNAR
jgi:predicted metal-dependent hydrolase